jgi:hypothetical protein
MITPSCCKFVFAHLQSENVLTLPGLQYHRVGETVDRTGTKYHYTNIYFHTGSTVPVPVRTKEWYRRSADSVLATERIFGIKYVENGMRLGKYHHFVRTMDICICRKRQFTCTKRNVFEPNTTTVFRSKNGIYRTMVFPGTGTGTGTGTKSQPPGIFPAKILQYTYGIVHTV